MKQIFSFLLIALIGASCQTADVRIEYNKEVDFFKYRTFNWLPGKEVKDTKGFQSLKSQKVKNVIQSLLAEKGIVQAEKADLLVAINVTEKEKVYYTSRNNFYGYRYWGYYGFRTYEPEYYTVSTLFVALVEPDTKKAVWEGSVEDWQYSSMSNEKMEKLLRALFDKFPPVAENAYQEVK